MQRQETQQTTGRRDEGRQIQALAAALNLTYAALSAPAPAAASEGKEDRRDA